MSEATRWSVKVSRGTDEALRSLLATRRARKGDLSRFVEEAVNRELLWQTVDEVRARIAALDADEVARIVDEELAGVRAAYGAAARS